LKVRVLNPDGTIIDYPSLYHKLQELKMDRFLPGLPESRQALLPKWKESILSLADLSTSSIDLNSSEVRIGQKKNCDHQ